MSQLNSQKKTWIWLVSLLFLFILLGFFLFQEGPKEYPDYTSGSPAPMGTKGFYTYLEQEALNVEQWEYSSESLPTSEKNNLFFLIAPPLFTDEMEQQAYISYMEAGNTIVLLRNNPDTMFGLETEYIDEVTEETSQLEGIGNYEALVQSSFSIITEDTTDKVLLTDERGRTLAIERNYGDGKLIVITEPNWITNKSILEQDHLAILLDLINFASYSTVRFDEYIYGAEERASIFSMYPKWLLVLCMELILLTILWLWLKGKRFGPIIEPREATVRFSDERLKALAIWYVKGKRYKDALTIQSNYIKQLLQERHGIPYRKTWWDSLDSIDRALSGITKKELEGYITDFNEILMQEKITKREFLMWSQKNDRLRKEVEEG